jgi:hypothetical protein
MSSGDGMDSLLKYILTDACEFLLSLYARHVRLMLPEAQSGWCLSAVESPRACLSEGPGPCPRSMREGEGQTGGEILFVRT